MSVDFSNGAIGTIQASRTASGQLDQLRLRVYGETGSIEMIYDTGKSTLRACLAEDVHSATWRDVPFDPVDTNYQRFVQAVRAGKTLEPSLPPGGKHPEGPRQGDDLQCQSHGRSDRLRLATRRRGHAECPLPARQKRT